MKFAEKLSRFFPEFLLLIAYFVIQLPVINSDFWNDELYTMQHFVFVPVITTVTDYHVPNNHIFFNLICNIYLKLTGVGNLHSLMDHPFLIRILPLIYSLVLLIFTYETGRKFFNRQIALLAISILITTIVHFNFALQIRGYELSTLLVSAMIFFSFAYLQSRQSKNLVATAVTVLLALYTIPSNLYPVFSLLVYLAFVIAHSYLPVSNTKEISYLIPAERRSLIRLLLAVLAAAFVSVALYSFIFDEVFSNAYVKPGEAFEFSKLQFYFSSVYNGFISNRWPLVILFLAGIVFNLGIIKKHFHFLLPLLVICVVPLLIVYVRGDRSPLRTFTVLMPILSIILASGLHSLWVYLSKTGRYGVVFAFGTLAYCILNFYSEKREIDDRILSDIRSDGRSQDLYYQYYAAHYHPLEVVSEFGRSHYRNEIPVVITGCEPHGIHHYLDKSGIKYYLADRFDSVLYDNESIYIITNHPFHYKGSAEYSIEFITPEFTYHNILLFRKNQSFINNLDSGLRHIDHRFRDSVNYLFSIYSPVLIPNYLKNDRYFFVSDLTMNDLQTLRFISRSKPYLYYIETVNRNSGNLMNSIRDSGSELILSEKIPGKKLYIFRHAGCDTAIYKTVFRQSGDRPERLDSGHIYSSGLNARLKNEVDSTTIVVSVDVLFEGREEGKIVCDVTREGENISWQQRDLKNYFSERDGWKRVITVFDIDRSLNAGDLFKVFVFNSDDRQFRIARMTIQSSADME